MITAYDHWKTSDPADDSCESDVSRDDQVAAAVNAQMGDVPCVASAVDGMYSDSEAIRYGGALYTHFAADLARVLTASDAAFQADALRYFQQLRSRVRDQLTAEAASLITDNEGPDEAPLPWET